jgi:hypothetical protein
MPVHQSLSGSWATFYAASHGVWQPQYLSLVWGIVGHSLQVLHLVAADGFRAEHCVVVVIRWQ